MILMISRSIIVLVFLYFALIGAHPIKQAKDNDGRFSVLELNNYRNAFHTTALKIGSNEDTVNVLIDTGSTNLWVTNSSICTNTQKIWCDVFGTFEASKSSTLKRLGKTATSLYGSGMKSTNQLVTDTVRAGNLTFDELQLGVSQEISQNNSPGILGLSFYKSENTILSKIGRELQNGFGLYLGEPGDGQKGSLIFGGIDYAKILTGLTSIETIDKKLNHKNQKSWTFKLHQFSLGNSQISGNPAPALLDTGCTNIIVPDKVWSELVHSLQAKQINNTWTFKCPKQFDDFTFQFDNNATITIPSQTVFSVDGDNCSLSHIEKGKDEYQLGAYFLRFAYLYFDIDQKSVLIGQAKFTESTNIKAYTKEHK